LQHPALKPEDLIGIPWRITLALQADGWYLRADVIWAKPNSMPEPARDRPTRSHEYVFLLSKSRRYYYDAGAIAEPAVSDHPSANRFVRRPQRTHGNRGNGTSWTDVGGKRNRRDVWQLKSEPSRRLMLISPCSRPSSPKFVSWPGHSPKAWSWIPSPARERLGRPPSD